MKYGVYEIKLSVALPRDERALLAAKLRSFRQITAAVVDEHKVRLYYSGVLPVQQV